MTWWEVGCMSGESWGPSWLWHLLSFIRLQKHQSISYSTSNPAETQGGREGKGVEGGMVGLPHHILLSAHSLWLNWCMHGCELRLILQACQLESLSQFRPWHFRPERTRLAPGEPTNQQWMWSVINKYRFRHGKRITKTLLSVNRTLPFRRISVNVHNECASSTKSTFTRTRLSDCLGRHVENLVLKLYLT